MKKALAALVLSCAASGALAQTYPAKAVRFVVPFAPGGVTDVLARLMAQRLGEAWGQSVIVENRAGAGGNIGVQAVAKSAPDGYTVLVTSSAIAVNVTLSASPGYDVERDFAPVINVASSPNMIITGEKGPRTLRELIDGSRAAGVVYGSAGTGTTPHLTAEFLFRTLAHLQTTHVPYKGAGPAVSAALADEVPVLSVAMPTALPHLRSGKLRGLAVTSRSRVAALPDVPTVEEAGFPGFEDLTWVGVFVPAGTPAPALGRLSADINAFLARADTRERLAGLGFEPVGGTPDAFSAYLKSEVAKWARVVRETGAKVE